jgi:hypothetical protein
MREHRNADRDSMPKLHAAPPNSIDERLAAIFRPIAFASVHRQAYRGLAERGIVNYMESGRLNLPGASKQTGPVPGPVPCNSRYRALSVLG